MHIHKTKKLIKTALYAAIIASAAGAATGTYAWYQYQKDVNLGFIGTTIKADKQIQIGLRSDGRLSKIDPETSETVYFDEDYPLGDIEVENYSKLHNSDENDCYIYWVRGNAVDEILKNFESYLGTATERLHPISAGKYVSGMEEDVGNEEEGYTKWNGFKKTPSHRDGQTEWSGLVTDYEDYYYLPLVFRVISNETEDDGSPKYVPNEKIYLSDFLSKDEEKEESDPIDLSKALRCKVDYPTDTDRSRSFIFDPNVTDEDYTLPVGGILNLQPDVYYDVDYVTKKEIAYGQFEGEVKYNSTKNPELDMRTAYYHEDTKDEDLPEGRERCTTFLANHNPGYYGVDMEQSTPCTCQTKKTIVPTNLDVATDANVIATTQEGTHNYYTFVDMSVYLEGWDENIINVTAGRTFSVEMQFSIK